MSREREIRSRFVALGMVVTLAAGCVIPVQGPESAWSVAAMATAAPTLQPEETAVAINPTDTPTLAETAVPSPTPTASPSETPTPTFSLTETPSPTPTPEPTATRVPTKELSREEQIKRIVENKLRINGFSPEERRELQDLIIKYFPKIVPPTREEVKKEFPYIEEEFLAIYEQVVDPVVTLNRIGIIYNNEGKGFFFTKLPGVGDRYTCIYYDEAFYAKGGMSEDYGLSEEGRKIANMFSAWKEMIGALAWVDAFALYNEDPRILDTDYALRNDWASYVFKAIAMEKSQKQGWGTALGDVPQRVIGQAHLWADELGLDR